VLSAHRHKFSGVLNGIDHEAWCPEADPYTPAKFSASDPANKEECKRLLLEELGLPYTRPARLLAAAGDANGANGANGAHNGNGNGNGTDHAPPEAGRPLVAVVSRLTVQKGLPLILHGLRTALARGAQVVVLGAASEPAVQAEWEAMAAEYAKGGDARLVLRYDEGLAHRIYAGADVILVRFI
jgi:starch synthase